jgi:hypothetical protein
MKRGTENNFFRTCCRGASLLSHRKGVMDLPYSELIQLIFKALMLIIILGFSYSLISLFIGGEEHYRAQRNFKLLTDQIEATGKERLTSPENSVILQLPENYMVLGFDKNAEYILSAEKGLLGSLFQKASLSRVGKVAIERPKKCDLDTACICLATVDDAVLYTFNPVPMVDAGNIRFTQNPLAVGDAEIAFGIVECKELDGIEMIGGTQESASVAVWGPDAKFQTQEKQMTGFRISRDLVLNTQKPMNVEILISGKSLLLDAYDPARATTGGGFGGAGSTGSY